VLNRSRLVSRLGAAVLALGLLAPLATAVDASAATKACKKGYTRNKAKKCVRKKKTTKKATATTVKAGVTTTTAKGVASKGVAKFGELYNSVNASSGAPTLQEERKMTQAWLAQNNSTVNGYKIQIELTDIKADTAKTTQAVKEFDKDGVLAIVGQQAINGLPASDKYLDDHKLPILGGSPYLPEFDSQPMYFPVDAGFNAGVYGQIAAARDVGSKFFDTIYCTETTACAFAIPVLQSAAQREGIKFAASPASANAPDYTANCLSAKQAGADFLQNNGINMANLVRDCARQNYHPVFAQGGIANQSVIDSAKGEQIAGNLYEAGIWYDGPELANFHKALNTTDLVSSTPGQNSVMTWDSLEMMASVLRRMTVANPTRQDFLNALYTVKGETLGGLVQPIDYTVQKPGTGLHAGNDCWTEHLVKDGKYFHMDKSGQIVNRLTWICGTGKKYTSAPPT